MKAQGDPSYDVSLKCVLVCPISWLVEPYATSDFLISINSDRVLEWLSAVSETNGKHGQEICQVEENGETAKGEALYYEGLHLYASWLAQILQAIISMNMNMQKATYMMGSN